MASPFTRRMRARMRAHGHTEAQRHPHMTYNFERVESPDVPAFPGGAKPGHILRAKHTHKRERASSGAILLPDISGDMCALTPKKRREIPDNRKRFETYLR